MESLRFSRSIYLKNVEVHSEAEENSTDLGEIPQKEKKGTSDELRINCKYSSLLWVVL